MRTVPSPTGRRLGRRDQNKVPQGFCRSSFCLLWIGLDRACAARRPTYAAERDCLEPGEPGKGPQVTRLEGRKEDERRSQDSLRRLKSSRLAQAGSQLVCCLLRTHLSGVLPCLYAIKSIIFINGVYFRQVETILSQPHGLNSSL